MGVVCGLVDGTYYKDARDDPEGPSSGSVRVLRGGSWSTGRLNTGLPIRDGYTPGLRKFIIGFRVSRTP